MSLNELDRIAARAGLQGDQLMHFREGLALALQGGLVIPANLSAATGISVDMLSYVLDQLAEHKEIMKSTRTVCDYCGTPVELGIGCGCGPIDAEEAQASVEEVVYLRSTASNASPAVQLDERAAGRARIAVVTALPKEAAAVLAVFNNRGNVIRQRQVYDVGEIPGLNGIHYVIHTLLPTTGNNTAAGRAAALLGHFPKIDQVIMVGIAGAVPNPEKPDRHVRLGDIVVLNAYGIVQFDSGRQLENGTFSVRTLPRPPDPRLIDACRAVETEISSGVEPIKTHIDVLLRRLPNCSRPPVSADVLNDSGNKPVKHPRDAMRKAGVPRFFSGKIGSSNLLVRDAKMRDMVRDQHDVLAIEMEGSGIADATWDRDCGYFVVRGLVDYCNGQKDDAWHSYGACAAAGALKAILGRMATPTAD